MVSSFVMWLATGFVISIYAVISVILDYHWRRYGKGNETVALFKRVYFFSSGVIIVSVLSILFFITFF